MMTDYEDQEEYAFYGYPCRVTLSERRAIHEFLKTIPQARELDAFEEELEWHYRQGTPESVRLCANTIFDLRIQMYRIVKKWARENLDE